MAVIVHRGKIFDRINPPEADKQDRHDINPVNQHLYHKTTCDEIIYIMSEYGIIRSCDILL